MHIGDNGGPPTEDAAMPDKLKPITCAPDCPEHLYADWDSEGEFTHEGDPGAAED